MREVPCPTCEGTRLKPEVLAVTVEGRSIAEVSALSIGDAAEWLQQLLLSDRDRMIGERVLKEINARLGFLVDVGLHYLSLDRAAATLAGGEAQRIRLATQIGSGLVGVLYVLDEPSIGLHQRDNHRLIETLQRLKSLGNTLIVVEHDEDTIRTADWVVDIGPYAGEHGGRIVVSGTVDDLRNSEESITGAYLSGRREIPVPPLRRPAAARSRGRRRGRPRAQPAQRRRRLPARLLRGGHRGQRVGQVQPRQRHPVRVAGQQDQRRQAAAGAAQARPRRRATRQGRRRRPVADRAHAAVQPGHLHGRLRPHPQAVLRDHRGEDPRLPAGPLLVQRQGWPLRELRRRRHDQDRDELPARRLRPLRGVQGRPVQPRDPRRALQGQDDQRGSRDADRRGGRVLQADLQDRPAPRHPGRRRARLRAARPAGADAVRRRGPAGEAGGRAAEAVHRSDDLRAGRADHRPALRGRQQAARRAALAGRQGQLGHRHRAQPRRDQDRRLDHRHGSGGRFGRRPGRRHRHAGRDRPSSRIAHRPLPGPAARGSPDGRRPVSQAGAAHGRGCEGGSQEAAGEARRRRPSGRRRRRRSSGPAAE